MAVKLRVVSHEMFDRGADALALHSFYIGDRGAGREKRVFAKVLKIPAIQRASDKCSRLVRA